MAIEKRFARPLYTADDSKRLVMTEKDRASLEGEAYRSPWRKDYARLIHSPAFRRLQGKTQLFPNHESDFFRNRLTHSIEVAQIAKSIAIKVNNSLLPEEHISPDIVEIAALAHDLGHPPFGHNGETALDECMREHDGGFEGNAQTLRILARVEKKVTETKSEIGEHQAVVGGKDNRRGLNLTARTLAAILKYDKMIPMRNADRGDRKDQVSKGYYECDKEIVEFLKQSVLGTTGKEVGPNAKFKTVECQIMDIADDIAYSTYDLEDAFKAGFLDPLKLLAFKKDFYEEIAREIQEDLQSEYSGGTYKPEELLFSDSDVVATIADIFAQIFDEQEGLVHFEVAGKAKFRAEQIAQNGYLRTDFTSDLVSMFISGVRFTPNVLNPALSKVFVEPATFKMIETLKKISYKSLIMSPMLKMAEYRGKDIIKKIFEVLNTDKKGVLLLPKDYQDLYNQFKDNESERKRIICDFIAGMTDRYALEFYNRLFGTNAETIHKPF